MAGSAWQASFSLAQQTEAPQQISRSFRGLAGRSEWRLVLSEATFSRGTTYCVSQLPQLRHFYKINNSALCSRSVIVFRNVITINSHYFPNYHWSTRPYKQRLCCLWRRNRSSVHVLDELQASELYRSGLCLNICIDVGSVKYLLLLLSFSKWWIPSTNLCINPPYKTSWNLCSNCPILTFEKTCYSALLFTFSLKRLEELWSSVHGRPIVRLTSA